MPAQAGIQKHNDERELDSRLRGSDETGILKIMKTSRYIVCDGKTNSRLAAGAIVLLVVLFASTAFGDVVDDSLPPDAPQMVKASARNAIQSGLDQDGVGKLTRAMLQHRFEGQQIRHCHALMIQAHNSGMPVEPLMNKAYEGMAKGVGPSLVLKAMERVQERNTQAYRHAKQLSQDKAQMAGLGNSLSAAMAAGFAPEEADRITQMIRQRAQTVQPDEAYSLALECFYTARDVSRLGVSSEATADMLGGALENGFNHQKMRAMRYAFMHQARQSEPQKLAHRFAESIQAGKGFQKGPGHGPGSSGEGTGGPGPGPGGSGSSGNSSSGGSSGSGNGSGSGGSGSGGSGSGGSGSGSGGSGGSGPGHGKQ
jgi:hypothetical protein